MEKSELVDADIKDINFKLDHIARVVSDIERRYENARVAGKRLMDACFVATYDPSVEKIQLLREAMSQYLSEEAGNFYSSLVSATT